MKEGLLGLDGESSLRGEKTNQNWPRGRQEDPHKTGWPGRK